MRIFLVPGFVRECSRVICLAALALLLPQAALAQQVQTVKITPLGSRTGEYCVRDRALLFEDPTGVRILYDPGVTVPAAQIAGSEPFTRLS